MNNPVKYNDPSGHLPCTIDGECPYTYVTFDTDTASNGEWVLSEKVAIAHEAGMLARALARDWNNFYIDGFENGVLARTGENLEDFLITPDQAWDMVFGGPVNFSKFGNSPGYAGRAVNHQQVNIYTTSDTYISNHSRVITHELGHVFDNALCVADPNCDETAPGAGANPGRNSLRGTFITNYGDTDNGYNGYAGGWDVWQFRRDHTAGENFADMFVGWTYDYWWNDRDLYPVDLSNQREDHMNQNMILWLALFYNN